MHVEQEKVSLENVAERLLLPFGAEVSIRLVASEGAVFTHLTSESESDANFGVFPPPF